MWVATSMGWIHSSNLVNLFMCTNRFTSLQFWGLIYIHMVHRILIVGRPCTCYIALYPRPLNFKYSWSFLGTLAFGFPLSLRNGQNIAFIINIFPYLLERENNIHMGSWSIECNSKRHFAVSRYCPSRYALWDRNSQRLSYVYSKGNNSIPLHIVCN